MNKVIVNKDLTEMKGYCKAGEFKEQFRKLKENLASSSEVGE